MNNKLFSRLKDLVQKENRARLAVLLGAAAMLLILLSELFTPSGKTAAARDRKSTRLNSSHP